MTPRVVLHRKNPVGFILLSLFLSTAILRAQSNLFLFVSSTGDYVGQGQTYATDQTNQFTVSGSPTSITVFAFGFSCRFNPSPGSSLSVGSYSNTARFATATSLGLDIGGNGRGCNVECGSFDINELQTNGTGNITRLWITFSNKCECFNPPMIGEIRYNSLLAPSNYYDLLNVSAWGAGRSNNLAPQYGQSLVPPNTTGIVAVAAGVYHNLALNSDGRILAWGYNQSGQTTVPATATNVVALAAGLNHSLALRSNGTVTAWGSPVNGQTSAPSSATNISSIAAGWYHNVALRSNGTVVAWGAGTFRSSLPNFGQSIVPTNLSGITAIAAGAYHSLALRSNGTIVAWGLNASGQTNVPSGLSNVVVIAAGASNSFALKNDGTLVAWGDNAYGQTNIPAGLTNVSLISAGAGHQLALRMDGTVVAWGLNGNGQTNIPTDLTNVSAVVAGGYHSLALLNLGPIRLLNQPWDQTVFKGQPATFKVGVSGAGPLAYQWQFNINDLLGQTNSWLTLDSAQFTNAGNYRLLVTNSFGAATSSIATLTVNDTAPYFAQQPAAVNVVVNSNATIAAAVGGIAPFTYQWQFNGTNLPGRTNLTLAITNAQLASEGPYSVIVSNAFGYTVSSNGFLNVIDLAESLNTTNQLWFTSVPGWFPETNVTHDGVAAATTGNLSTFPAGALLQTTLVGPGTLRFWWQLSTSSGSGYLNLTMDGVIQASLNFLPGWQRQTVYVPEGIHYFEWSGVKQTTLSTVIAYLDDVSYELGPTSPLFVSRPSDLTIAAGSDVTLASTTGGTPPRTNQWFLAGTALPGATGTSLALPNAQPTNSGTYTLTVSNAYGTTNLSVTLTVTNSAPYILTQPASLEMVRGGNAIFSATARGSDPLGYQWQLNQSDIPNATNASLVLTQLQTNQAGTYRLAITNAFGSVFSSNATLTLVPTVIVGWGSVFTSSPNPPSGLTNVSAISAGDDFSVALRNDGTVYAWGWNAFSKLSVPAGLTNVVAVSAGGFHGSALLSSGTVTEWGDPFFDASVNVPVGLTNVIQTAAGYKFNMALKNDQTLVAWGNNLNLATNVPPGLSNIVSIAAGWYHGLAVRQDGTVAAWGYNASGQTNVPSGLSNVVAVAGGLTHSMALQRDGSIVAWGSPFQTNFPASATNIVAIAAGPQHSLALRKDGTVVAWGSGTSGKATVPFWLTNVVAIAGGTDHSLALLNDGSPYVVREPWNQVAQIGTTVRLDVAALGQTPLMYQWQLNGADVTGATNASLVLTNLSFDRTGTYRCVISNAVGTVSTRVASLTGLRGTPQFTFAGMGLNGDGTFRLSLSGVSGHGEIVLYASTNLVDWQPIFTNPPVVGELIFTDPSPTNLPFRFYRFEER